MLWWIQFPYYLINYIMGKAEADSEHASRLL